MSGEKNRQQVRSQLQRSDKPVFAGFGQCSQVLGKFWRVFASFGPV